MKPLLEVRALTIDVPKGEGWMRVVDGVDFSIGAGERVALVGESGSGKSMTARALMRLDDALRIGGAIRFAGEEVLGCTEAEMRALRGSGIGMVFQDPMASLDPFMRVGDQVAEVLRIRGVGRAEAHARAVAILAELGVRDAASRSGAYPHEFSGGMRQRVVLAMALVAGPKLLVADEPTTALDARIQQQVLDLIDDAAADRGLGVLLITHNLGIVAGFADRVLVMYSGRIVEEGPVEQIFAAPAHPYTRGLIAAVPRADMRVDRLPPIDGAPPSPARRPSGCAFHPRCPVRLPVCVMTAPQLRPSGGGSVACHLAAAEEAMA
ncbi:ABC transporter ATP-binding protein [Mesorhizobium sp. BR1-1-16]|uniref:ABC transporter ATP-binding protein n=1 Tax=Mesorhizobium sp. BR1-1-16 TaxID=2876653 RepID=UPI001CC95B3C|nr:ABC transporter ATP-binding protein [Mesorhizobium sp. BR1-1-16]MBZ9939412.1 ABC transporter ATP-binding protein [Mesorhizobium sp. BR1-1-16]